jgi:hypothetical protein
MTRIAQCAFLLAAGLTAATAFGEDPKAPPKAKVEFRWLSDKPVKGLTEEKGFQTSCYPDLSYPYAKPVLTNADVAGAVLKTHDFTKNGLGVQHSVDFQLKDAALKTLVAEAGDRPSMHLAIFVDGKYWGTGHFQKAEAAKFTPFAGFIPSKAEAERIVEACK